MEHATPDAELGLSSGLVSADPVSYRARVSPQRLACIALATGERLAYGALDERIARCVGWLSGLLGDPRAQRVSMLARNGIEEIALALACQRAGAVFVPLNWRLAGAELAALMQDCSPALLVHDREFCQEALAAAASLPHVILLPTTGQDSLATGIAGAATIQAVEADADAPCMLLYTSGTTGRPKGVIITRRNAFFCAVNFAMVGEVGPASVTLADLPLFHTIGLVAVCRTTLMMGGTLVLSDRFVPARTLAALSDPALGITHYFGVPQMAVALRGDPGFAAADLSRLHAIFLGGAPLTQSLIEAYLADGIALVNGYGMSEAGTVLHVPIDRDAVRANPGSVGLPAPVLELRIVGSDGKTVCDGEVGEIWLRGPGVTPGYWNKPEETRAAFVDGWYRTGDLARREPNGFYRLVDRLKDMYISGGENVYPAEVEAVLVAHPAVLDAAVIGIADERWGEAGLACIVLRPGATADAAEIAGHCDARLARFKRPAAIRFVEAIPRTASGKIQKPLLRQSFDAGVYPHQAG